MILRFLQVAQGIVHGISTLPFLFSHKVANASLGKFLETEVHWEGGGGKELIMDVMPYNPPPKTAISSRGTDLCQLEMTGVILKVLSPPPGGWELYPHKSTVK